MVEIDEHHDSGLRRHACQRDEADRDRHGPIVAQEPDEPDPPDEREGHREHHEDRLRHAPEVDVEEQEDDQQHGGHDEPQGRLGALHVLVLTTPLERVPLGKREHVVDHALRIGDVATDVAAGDVHVDPCRRLRPLGADHHRTGDLPNRGDLAERDLTHADRASAAH